MSKGDDYSVLRYLSSTAVIALEVMFVGAKPAAQLTDLLKEKSIGRTRAFAALAELKKYGLADHVGSSQKSPLTLTKFGEKIARERMEGENQEAEVLLRTQWRARAVTPVNDKAGQIVALMVHLSPDAISRMNRARTPERRKAIMAGVIRELWEATWRKSES